MTPIEPSTTADSARARRRQAIAERINQSIAMGGLESPALSGDGEIIAKSAGFPSAPKPGPIGFGTEAIPEAMQLLEGWVSADVPGAQVYISLAGQTVASFGLGWAREGLTASPSILNTWLCCVKPLLAIAFAQIWERGLVHPDVPITEVVPEVGSDKKGLTFRHLLSHSAPLRPDPLLRVLFESRATQLAAIRCAKLPVDAEGGFHAVYSHAWSWFVLAEAVERLDGRPFPQYLEEEVLRPAGSEFWIHISPAQFDELWPRVGLMFELRGGARRVADLTSSRGLFELRCPGMTGLASASAVGRLYEALLTARTGGTTSSILQSPTVEALTRPARLGCYDPHFSGYVNWGLGFLTEPSVFGSYCSPQVFGHVGGLGLVSLADPADQLVIAYALNGMIEREESDRRDVALVDAIYRDLRLNRRPLAPRIIAVDTPREMERNSSGR